MQARLSTPPGSSECRSHERYGSVSLLRTCTSPPGFRSFAASAKKRRRRNGIVDPDDSEPFIRIDQMEKSVELLYDKNATANDDELSKIEEFNSSPDHHRDE